MQRRGTDDCVRIDCRALALAAAHDEPPQRFCASLCGDSVLSGGNLTVLYVNRFGLFPLPQTYVLDVGV
jgi:hypothetical protein